MRLKLVFDSTIPIANVDCDLQKIRKYLAKLKQYEVKHEILDIAKKSLDEVFSIYSEAIVPSVMKKVGIRRVFGSKKQSMFLFGKQVPALLVYEDNLINDVYPQIRRWAGRDEKVSIELFLEDLLKLTELSISEKHMEEASRALANNMPRWAVLCCMFAIEAFIWRVLWGKKDLAVIGTDGKRHSISSVDFVYHYARKGERDFVKKEDYEKFQNSNKRLFKKLAKPDDFLLSQVVKLGVIKEHESGFVRDFRIIRNFSSHFNPFEVTLKRYREVVQRLGSSIEISNDRSEEEIAKIVFTKTKDLLSSWKGRVNSSGS